MSDGDDDRRTRTGAMKADLGAPTQFFDRVATQIERRPRERVHAEQLRREPRPRPRARVASQLRDESLVDGFEELALALASFPR